MHGLEGQELPLASSVQLRLSSPANAGEEDPGAGCGKLVSTPKMRCRTWQGARDGSATSRPPAAAGGRCDAHAAGAPAGGVPLRFGSALGLAGGLLLRHRHRLAGGLLLRCWRRCGGPGAELHVEQLQAHRLRHLDVVLQLLVVLLQVLGRGEDPLQGLALPLEQVLGGPLLRRPPRGGPRAGLRRLRGQLGGLRRDHRLLRLGRGRRHRGQRLLQLGLPLRLGDGFSVVLRLGLLLRRLLLLRRRLGCLGRLLGRIGCLALGHRLLLRRLLQRLGRRLGRLAPEFLGLGRHLLQRLRRRLFSRAPELLGQGGHLALLLLQLPGHPPCLGRRGVQPRDAG
mmetsp:Transcript_138305/g.429986  ORF Transcript_138305/g.429986 Transcript_138305/m.429986 type:complete len:340 (-) Transcript_138305:223-1242(-)